MKLSSQNQNTYYRVEAEADELAAKGCMRWNTDKYTIGIFGCDTDNCNKDLDQGDCAHVCEEKKETGMEKPKVLEQVIDAESNLLWPFDLWSPYTFFGSIFNSMN